MNNLEQQVGETVELIGVLVALITLFTLEQERRLDQEYVREGGQRKDVLKRVRNITIGLCVSTGLAVVVLFPLFKGTFETIDFGASVSAVLSVFSLVWVLLIALLIWQIGLVCKVKRDLDALG